VEWKTPFVTFLGVMQALISSSPTLLGVLGAGSSTTGEQDGTGSSSHRDARVTASMVEKSRSRGASSIMGVISSGQP